MWPWGLAASVGRVLGWLAGSVWKIRRTEVENRVDGALIQDASQIASGMYSSLGTGLYELLWTAAPGCRLLEDKVRFTVRAEQVLATVKGSGAVVMTAHTGNWDLIACAVASRAPLWVVSKRLQVQWLDRLWQGLRRRRGVRIVDAQGALRAGRDVLAAGGLLAMIVDQAPEREHGVLIAPFLGRPALHDLAPALLAARTKKPLLLALGRRLTSGVHEVDVVLHMDPPSQAGRVWAEEATRSAILALERFIRSYPEQWLWLHRRWKGVPPTAGNLS